jgi:hypothetical protein
VGTDKKSNQVLSVHFEGGIFRNDGDLWEAKNLFLRGNFARLSKWIMQSEQLRCAARQHDKDFVIIVS